MTATSAARAIGSSSRGRRLWQRYMREARRPAHCILLILPLALIYEVCAWFTRGRGPEAELLAHSAIEELLVWFGFAGAWIPAVVLVATLLIWHRQTRDRWRVRAWVPFGLLVEGLVLCTPLLVLSAVFPQQGAGIDSGLYARIIQGLGAGIYEELVFRLLLITGLAWVLRELLHLPEPIALWAGVGLAAILFSACHFAPVGLERFGWGAFWFRLTAGTYLSTVFVRRGLGSATAAHAAYNMLLAAFPGHSA